MATPEKTLKAMAGDPHGLHDHLATRFEAALGKQLPQMEVRFDNISISADVKVLVNDDSFELPTIPNVLKKTFVPAKSAVVKKEILKNVSGVLKPGTMTLILGQPGSGKSSLMKLLSGRFPMDKNVSVDGAVTYNGVAQDSLKKRLPQFVSYVTQRDNHFPTLTVKETLEFAHAFTGGELVRRGEELLTNGTPEQNAAALDAASELFKHYPDIITEQLGLEKCKDTVVGDAMLRGVSGGERKRVTLGEMEFGLKYVALMDEISTGLDSATTFDIVSAQRSIVKKLRKTIAIALLQPAPEVYDLFDDVVLLNDGHVVYYGPPGQAVEYFTTLGLVCPPERDVADFLLDIGTAQQAKYETGDIHAPRTASELAEKFKESRRHWELLEKLDAPIEPILESHVTDHVNVMPAFHQSVWDSTLTLLRRQGMLAWRDTPFIAGRSVMTILMGLLYGSTFYQFNPTNVQVVLGIVFSSAVFISLSQMSQVPTFMAAREVFYKQRGANFYRTSSYVFATAMSQVPLAVIESIVYGTMVYWMTGFDSSARSFVLYLIVLTLCNLMMGMWFFFVATVSPNIYLANPLSSLSTVFFILFAGFIVLKGQIPDYLIELHWISPISWGVRAIAVIQYRSDTFDVCEYDGINYCEQFGMMAGEYYLNIFEIPSSKSWIALGIVYLVAALVLFMGFAVLALEYCRYESPEGAVALSNDSEDGVTTAMTKGPESYALLETPTNGSRSTGGSAAVIVDVIDARPVASNFVPVTLAFQDLWYSVPSPANPKESIDLLKGVSGFARPGTLTALMGSSGAGKTTLMDVIAGRKTGGQIKGGIFLNGYEASDLAIRRATGYCEQMDVHSDSTTIREALVFSAFLRQDSSVSASAKYDTVNEVLELLDLTSIADKMVRGSSVEQMKRLSIGVELAAQPSVLFLDEPTSGLDARSAKIVMDSVRKVANTGRTVVCTIHQPSSDVFTLFDSLLLLKRGGQMVFFGELGGADSRNLVQYFEKMPGVTPLRRGANPANWMLECIGAGVSGGAPNDHASLESDYFVEYFNASPEHATLSDALANGDSITKPSANSQQVEFAQKRAADSATQFRFVVGRFMTMYWRTPSYTITGAVLGVVLAFVFGITFLDVDYATYQGLNSGMGMLFMTVLFNGFVTLNGIIPLAARDRAAYYRERASQTYSAAWYFIGSSFAEIPYAFVGLAIFTIVFFPMVGFTGFGTAVLFWLNYSLFVIQQAYLGQFWAYLMPSEDVAIVMGLLLNNVLYIYTGFSPPYESIPEGYKWLYTINPMRYPLSIAASLAFADCSTTPEFNATTGVFDNVGPELGCQQLLNAPVNVGNVTVKQYTESVFGMMHDDIARNFGITIVFIVIFRLLALLALRFVNHQKK